MPDLPRYGPGSMPNKQVSPVSEDRARDRRVQVVMWAVAEARRRRRCEEGRPIVAAKAGQRVTPRVCDAKLGRL